MLEREQRSALLSLGKKLTRSASRDVVNAGANLIATKSIIPLLRVAFCLLSKAVDKECAHRQGAGAENFEHDKGSAAPL